MDALHREMQRLPIHCRRCRIGRRKHSRRAHAVTALAPANFEISETRDKEIKQ